MKQVKNKFKREFRRQTRLAITAAIGFIIAFSWKDSILLLIKDYVERFTTMTSLVNISIVSSIAATALGVLLMVLTSELLKEKVK